MRATTSTTSAVNGSELSNTQIVQAVERLVTELSAKYPHSDPSEVAALVSASADSFANAKITEFVPVLIGQQVDRQLRASAHPLAS